MRRNKVLWRQSAVENDDRLGWAAARCHRPREWALEQRVLMLGTVTVLGLALLLGGATRAGFIGDVFLQLVSIPLLLAAIWLWLGEQTGPATRWRYLAGGLALAALLGQLLPLPAGLGAALSANPLGAAEAAGLQAPGLQSGWRTLSLTPHASWAAIMSLIVPAAIVASVARLEARARLQLCGVVLGLGALASLMGFLQVAQGPQSALRFFAFTNDTEAVGFFANRNHFAAQLYVTFVLAVAWLAACARDSLQPGAHRTRAVFWLAVAVALLVALTAGIAMARSRAGLLLFMAAVVAIAATITVNRREILAQPARGMRGAGAILVAAIGFAVVFAIQLGLYRMLVRFERDPLEDLRIPFGWTTLATIRESMPFGTGLGSFVPVYATVERAGDVFVGYANRAHDDLLEVLLETGLPGLLLLGVLLWWLGTRGLAIWRKPQPAVDTDHLLLQRAAFLAILLLLAHSLVDYPLRTGALAAVFAFCCGVLVEPGEGAGGVHSAVPGRRKAARTRPVGPAEQATTVRPEPCPVAARQQWVGGGDWPEAWRAGGGEREGLG